MQLAVLGVALALVLHEHLWWLALLFGVGMAAVAAAEAVSRPSASYEVRPNQAIISCAVIMSHGSTCAVPQCGSRPAALCSPAPLITILTCLNLQ